MQGPVDETDCNNWMNTVQSRVERELNWSSMTGKVQARVESGTCNVCSAPCSSCMHFNRARMGSNTDESSDEICRGNAASQFSVNEVNRLPSFMRRACDSLQHATSETSNPFSVNSSHDSFSENAESKANFRFLDMSEASEDVEMLPKLSAGGAVVEDQLPLKPDCISDQRTFSNKYEDSKGEEGHDDNISCISGTNDTNKSVGYVSRNDDRKNVACSSASVSCLGLERFGKVIQSQTASGSLDIQCDIGDSHNMCRRQTGYAEDSMRELPINLSTKLISRKLDSSVIPSPKYTDAGMSSSRVLSPCFHSRSGNSPSSSPSMKDLEEDPISHHQEKLPECAVNPLNSSLTEGVASESIFRHKSAANNCAEIVQDRECTLTGGGSDTPIKNYSKPVSDTKKNSGEPLDEALKCSDQNEHVEKLNESVELSNMKDPTLQAASGDESDESDIVEHDVKVCDICGDAGREDLLAICSRCSDGAEHTYCMREMLDKVPEGDWLCEECKFAEETGNQTPNKLETVDGNEKNDTVHTDLFDQLDTKDSDVEVNRTNKVNSSSQVTGKRNSDNFEVAPAAKRQAVETTLVSPKPSSPSRLGSLSRDSSFKSLDKGKVKSGHQISSGARANNDVLETVRSCTAASRFQTPRGVLLKSNSFSTSNLQPKVKPFDENLPQKQKGPRESATIDLKEGPTRMISKSMSFKAATLGRTNATEAKVKMLSSKVSHVQDQKGFRQMKERNNLERKNPSKLDRSLVSSITSSSTVSIPKGDQKLISRGEIILSNNRDLKAVHSDGKLTTLSKQMSNPNRKGSEIPLVSVGATSANGTSSSSAEQKLSQVSLKDEPSPSSSLTAERPSNIVSGILQDGLPQSRESINLGEKTRDNSGIRSRSSITTGGKGVSGQKSKEIGHAAQYSTIGSPRVSTVDVSAGKGSREEINKGSKLRAAIEAAMLKKPGIYRKNRLPDQSDELSTSSTDMNPATASQDQLSGPSKNVISGEGIHDPHAIPQICTASSSKQPAISDVKQFNVHLTETECSSRVGDCDSNALSDGKLTIKDLPSHASAGLAVPLKMPAIPEHEYIWQGAFEVRKSGKLPDLCNGIQAHLSTFASPKVIEIVSKFTHKVPLDEVPRSSTWPSQFHDSGTKDDNIALYFFAKDIESYERSYKCLLESMMKNDLALKGNFDGIELLIFPSNRLPEKSQRWNMLFFLWGVFRGRRVKCLDHTSGSLNKLHIPSLNAVPHDKDPPTAVMSISENLCTVGRLDKDSSELERSGSVSKSSFNPVAGVKLPILSSSEKINGDCDIKISDIDHIHVDLEENARQPYCELNSHSLSKSPTGSAQTCPEIRCTSAPLESGLILKPVVDFWFVEEQSYAECKLEAELQHFVTVTGAVMSAGKEEILDKKECKMKFEKNLEDDGLMDTQAAELDGTQTRVATMKELDGLQLNHKKRLRPDSAEVDLQSSSNGTIQAMPWNDANSALVDGGNASKKLKTAFSEMYGCNSTRTTGFVADLNEPGKSSPDEGKQFGTFDETASPENSGTSERHFFPVDSCNMEETQLGDISIPWKVPLSADEDQLHDGSPNLELALGAEKKPRKRAMVPFLVGIVDKKNEQDKPPDMLMPKEDEDDASASLSLSLSFPFSDKEQTVKPVSKTEQLLPERHHVNTSLLLFGGFPDG
ncbi:uncharacterized protein LOC131159286 isoform X2 [Malania oleifera]|uniref:uncharacterized protein LOC131159286 isoform X2 n=1 Tax=Malania oleifera TaxID=397392 RepID=UPI0025AE10E4|nr:uncharacterized protein LOC131159286 isoform X2 [Malania oleifera]